MIMNIKTGQEMYCATCKRKMKFGQTCAWSTNKQGDLRIHHKKCGKIKKF